MPWAIPHLKRRSEFLRAAREGSSWSMPGLVLQMRQRHQAEAIGGGARGEGDDVAARAIRLGLTASRKVGGAVERNRARRRLRALAEDMLPHAGRPGCDYVLIGRPATVSRPFAPLKAALAAALDRLHAGRGRAARPPVDGAAGPRRRGHR